MTSPLPVKTTRLILRAFTAADLDEFHEFQSIPEVTRFLYWGPRSRDESEKALRTRIGNSVVRVEGDTLAVAVERADTGTLIGDVNLTWESAEHRRAEIGFVFHPAHQGRGFAAEAAAEVLRIGFTDLGLRRIIGRCDGRNTASGRLMDRIGMTHEAVLRENELFKGEWADEHVYGILEHEWRGRPRSQ